MKVVLPRNQGTTPKEVPPLPLVPDEEDDVDLKDPTKTATFKLASNPSNYQDSPKYLFTMILIDGSQSVRVTLQWCIKTAQVFRGLNMLDGPDPDNTVADNKAPARHDLLKTMMKGAALTAYAEAVQQNRELRQEQAKALIQLNTPRQQNETGPAYRARVQALMDAVALPEIKEADILRGIQAILKAVCPYKALEKQKRFMRRKMRKPAGMTTRTYVNHLNRINYEELKYLPPFQDDQHLNDDEMMDILIFGLPKSWTNEMDKQDPFAGTMR